MKQRDKAMKKKVILYGEVKFIIGTGDMDAINMAIDFLGHAIGGAMSDINQNQDACIPGYYYADYRLALKQLTAAFFTPIMQESNRDNLQVVCRYLLNRCSLMLDKIIINKNESDKVKLALLTEITMQLVEFLSMNLVSDVLTSEYIEVVDAYFVSLSIDEILDIMFIDCKNNIVAYEPPTQLITPKEKLQGLVNHTKLVMSMSLKHLIRRVLKQDQDIFKDEVFLIKISTNLMYTFNECFSDLLGIDENGNTEATKLYVLFQQIYMRPLLINLGEVYDQEEAMSIYEKISSYMGWPNS